MGSIRVPWRLLVSSRIYSDWNALLCMYAVARQEDYHFVSGCPAGRNRKLDEMEVDEGTFTKVHLLGDQVNRHKCIAMKCRGSRGVLQPPTSVSRTRFDTVSQSLLRKPERVTSPEFGTIQEAAPSLAQRQGAGAGNASERQESNSVVGRHVVPEGSPARRASNRGAVGTHWPEPRASGSIFCLSRRRHRNRTQPRSFPSPALWWERCDWRSTCMLACP